MSWKTSAQRSAAATAYEQIISDAGRTLIEVRDTLRRLDEDTTVTGPTALQRGLTMNQLRSLVSAWRGRRSALPDLDITTDLQSFIRIATTLTTFDLSAGRTALRAAYAALITEGRALHNALSDNIAADGTVTESPVAIPKEQAAAFIAACQNFLTVVES